MKEKESIICSICADCRYSLVFKKDCISYKCPIERLNKIKDWRSKDLPYLIACSYYETKEEKEKNK